MSGVFLHFVFVDFENVQKVDLGAVEGKPVHVTLLIGKKQTWLDLPLVQQIHRLATQVELVEVGASGHNALDLTLAYYLGQAVQRSPAAQFSILSKDKDFEAMLGHLQRKGIKVARCDSFATLPFLSKPKKPAPVKSLSQPKAVVLVRTAVSAQATPTDERFEKLITRLKTNINQRPKKGDRLLAYINTALGGKLPQAEQKQRLEELVRRNVLKIEDKDKVRYL